VKKNIIFITVLGLMFVSSNSMGDGFTSSEVINAQRQNQVSVPIPVGNSNSISIGIQMQQQVGVGASDVNSVVGDGQVQNSTTNGSSLTAYAGGASNGGNYRYMNEQAAITVDATLVQPNSTQEVSGVVGGMGAITHTNGNAISIAGGVLENNGWSMSNQANSQLNPTAVNIDGFITY